MNKEEFIGKLQLCYFADRNAFEEIVSVYDKQKEVLDKIKEYIKEEEYQEEGYGTLVIETKKLKELLEEIE